MLCTPRTAVRGFPYPFTVQYVFTNLLKIDLSPLTNGKPLRVNVLRGSSRGRHVIEEPPAKRVSLGCGQVIKERYYTYGRTSKRGGWGGPIDLDAPGWLHPLLTLDKQVTPHISLTCKHITGEDHVKAFKSAFRKISCTGCGD